MSYTLTPKFEKELYTFFDWANHENEYNIYDKNGDILSWCKTLLVEFNETPRKKLDGFLKKVFQLYIIKNKNNQIEYTYTNIINKYKELKNPSKVTLDKQVDNLCEAMNLTLTVNENPHIMLMIDNNLDTTHTWWLCNLEYTTEQLINAFGEPAFTGNETTKHRYEWKFSIDNHIFSIYDWKFENSEFYDINEADWFLCGNSNKHNKKIIDLLDKCLLLK